MERPTPFGDATDTSKMGRRLAPSTTPLCGRDPELARAAKSTFTTDQLRGLSLWGQELELTPTIATLDLQGRAETLKAISERARCKWTCSLNPPHERDLCLALLFRGCAF